MVMIAKIKWKYSSAPSYMLTEAVTSLLPLNLVAQEDVKWGEGGKSKTGAVPLDPHIANEWEMEVEKEGDKVLFSAKNHSFSALDAVNGLPRVLPFLTPDRDKWTEHPLLYQPKSLKRLKWYWFEKTETKTQKHNTLPKELAI